MRCSWLTCYCFRVSELCTLYTVSIMWQCIELPNFIQIWPLRWIYMMSWRFFERVGMAGMASQITSGSGFVMSRFKKVEIYSLNKFRGRLESEFPQLTSSVISTRKVSPCAFVVWAIIHRDRFSGSIRVQAEISRGQNSLKSHKVVIVYLFGHNHPKWTDLIRTCNRVELPTLSPMHSVFRGYNFIGKGSNLHFSH